MPEKVKLEFASERRFRERNKLYYRFLHWPIWIFVFFITPGPLTFDLFARGFDSRMALWLAVVLAGTGIAGMMGQLPGVEPRPYILRFTEDKPNPWYRRICYTFAWAAAVTFALLNLAGLIYAVASGRWILRQMYDAAYFPIAGTIWVLGLSGLLPRVRRSTKGEGSERRYFYGTVWSVTTAQIVLLAMWKAMPRNPQTDVVKLVVYSLVLVYMGNQARKGHLPRTRQIVPGEWAVAD